VVNFDGRADDRGKISFRLCTGGFGCSGYRGGAQGGAAVRTEEMESWAMKINVEKLRSDLRLITHQVVNKLHRDLGLDEIWISRG